jgi:hypothetical protein
VTRRDDDFLAGVELFAERRWRRPEHRLSGDEKAGSAPGRVTYG